MDNVSAFLLVEVGLLAMAAYLLPSIVEWRHGRRRAWVIATNVVLGWTGVGWLVALLAAAAPTTPSTPAGPTTALRARTPTDATCHPGSSTPRQPA